MANEFSIDYSDVIKVYQMKVSDLTNQLISSEARIMASNRVIDDLSKKISELEKQPKTKRTVKNNDAVVDYNN